MSCFTSTDLGQCGCSGCGQTFTVWGCNQQPISGATVTVYDPTFTTVLASGTTNASGVVALTWAGNGSVGVEVSGLSSRFAAYQATLSLTCGGSTTLQMTAATGYACWAYSGCGLPTTTQLQCTATGFTGISWPQNMAASGFGWGTGVLTDSSGQQWVIFLTQLYGVPKIQVENVGTGLSSYQSLTSQSCPPSMQAVGPWSLSGGSGTVTITE